MIWLALTLACVPDDVDDTSTTDTADTAASIDTDPGTTGPADAFVGRWVSEGADLSPLFGGDPFNYVLIEADFRDDGTYTVVGEDAAGASYDFAGSYLVDDGTSPGTIVQTQTVPYDAVAEGIWSVSGDTLTFEVVQTSPDYGYTAATPEGGFGSTAGPGLAAGDNVQTYQRTD